MKLFVRKGLYVLGLGILIAGFVAFQLGAFTSDVVKADGCSVSRHSINGVPNDNGSHSWIDVTVPAGCTKIKIKAWGDGGNTYFPVGSGLVGIVDSANGGGGGHVIAELNVTPGETLRLLAGGQQYSVGGGGHYSYVWSDGHNQYMVVAPGGGGGAGAVAGFTQLGHGGEGGAFAGGGNGRNGVAGGQTAGGGIGAALNAGGAGGSGTSPGQAGGSNFSFTGGNLGYYLAGSGGKGYGGGGGGGSLGSGYPNYVNGMGGGGGGGTAYVNPSYRDDVVFQAFPASGRSPVRTADVDYSAGYYPPYTGYGGIGGPAVSYPNHVGGSGRVVAVFGEDLTVSESVYPARVGPSSFCLYGLNSPQAMKYNYPYQPPTQCTGRSMVCRAAFDGNVDDYVCRYECTEAIDDVYLFRGVCIGQ